MVIPMNKPLYLFVGRSASGKTTIANLITRFYDVTQGEVLYKGKNVKEFSLEQLRKEIRPKQYE